MAAQMEVAHHTGVVHMQVAHHTGAVRMVVAGLAHIRAVYIGLEAVHTAAAVVLAHKGYLDHSSYMHPFHDECKRQLYKDQCKCQLYEFLAIALQVFGYRVLSGVFANSWGNHRRCTLSPGEVIIAPGSHPRISERIT